jgi:iron-sulfur cluster repair protein YtfE (RIC family)
MLYPNTAGDFIALHPEEIIRYFSSKEHQNLRQSCRLINSLFDELLQQGGKEAQELADAFPLFCQLHGLIAEHLCKEDKILFPYALEFLSKIRELKVRPGKLMVGLLKGPLESMQQEHADMLALLLELRAGMKNYCFGEDCSEKMRLLCTELFTLEQSMRWHFYHQENVLYPKLRKEENELLTP